MAQFIDFDPDRIFTHFLRIIPGETKEQLRQRKARCDRELRAHARRTGMAYFPYTGDDE